MTVDVKSKFRIPIGQHLGRGGKTERLYQLEERRDQLVIQCAYQLGQLLGFNEEQIWTHSLPEALLAVLDSFEPEAARLAAEVFLAKAEERKVRCRQRTAVVDEVPGNKDKVST